MKHAVLNSLAHNFVDSYGSGIGLLIGHYEMDVYGEAARSAHAFVEINFLTGEVRGGPITDELAQATDLYRDRLPSFCETHGACLSDFKSFIVRFSNDYYGRHCKITVKDRFGKETIAEYKGNPARKLKILDNLGRLRKQPNNVEQP